MTLSPSFVIFFAGEAFGVGAGHHKRTAGFLHTLTQQVHRAQLEGPIMRVGCKMCVMLRPYGYPKFNAEEGVSGRFDGCYGLRQEGSLPACVAGCPNRALDFGDVAELEKEYGSLERGSISILPFPDMTKPNVYVKVKKSATEKLSSARV